MDKEKAFPARPLVSLPRFSSSIVEISGIASLRAIPF